jgi:hypothetical protein
MIGLNLKSQWKSDLNVVAGADSDTISFLGHTLFETLRSPDLSVPALMKEDNCVEFNSSFQQFIYEYLFRQQEIENTGKPKVMFTCLTEDEEFLQRKLGNCIDEAEYLSQEILAHQEKSIFFRLRWYSCDKINFMNQQVVRTPESKTFFNFRSFKESDFDLHSMVNKFSEDIDNPKDIKSIKSSIIRFLVLLNDSIAFN